MPISAQQADVAGKPTDGMRDILCDVSMESYPIMSCLTVPFELDE